jgi:hypothetical protein
MLSAMIAVAAIAMAATASVNVVLTSNDPARLTFGGAGSAVLIGEGVSFRESVLFRGRSFVETVLAEYG